MIEKQLSLNLPPWVGAFLSDYVFPMADKLDRMRFVLALTERNIRKARVGRLELPCSSAIPEISSRLGSTS